MDTFQLLSKTMQRKIWDMKWERLTPVQEKTIPLIIQTDHDVIVSANTASGKTEAAFLPILTKVEEKAQEELKVIYISPLKALINNQFERIERLCEHCDIQIHRWHGDVSSSQKKKLVGNPSGILQITPESLESLFINRTGVLKPLFQGVEFVVIDEIHSFLDSERGVQLRSLLSRMVVYTRQRPRIIGLSATISNFELIKTWVNRKNPELVDIVDSTGEGKELLFALEYFKKTEDGKLPLELAEDIREITKDDQAIIFCNARGTVEEATYLLNRLANQEGVKEGYYAYHSSIDKAEREFIEKTLSTTTSPKSVVSTSSLELGIDIGNIDLVVQLDTTFTVSSLKQRMGRSGRKQDAPQILQMYSTSEDSLAQSLAVMELLLEGWIEPAASYPLPFDILFHQIISMCQEHNGITWSEMLNKIEENDAFSRLAKADRVKLIDHMVKTEMLEIVPGQNEYIVGLEGERLLRSKDFYAVFMTTVYYEVINGIKKIGQLDKGIKYDMGSTIMLASKLWTITDIDHKKNKIYVQKAVNGKKPQYISDAGRVHLKIGEKIHEILCSDAFYPYMGKKAIATLEGMRRRYRLYDIHLNDRVAWDSRNLIVFEPYTGTIITNTLVWMLRSVTDLGVRRLPTQIERIAIPKEISSFEHVITKMRQREWKPEDLLPYITEKEMLVTKYSPSLPESLQTKMHSDGEIDLRGAMNFLNTHTFRFINDE